MFKKKRNGWFGLVFKSLLFCLLLFVAARFFLNTVAKLSGSTRQECDEKEELFV